MYITANKLVYLGVIKQACRDYVERKREKNSKLIEVEKFLRSIEFCSDCDINSDWLIGKLDSFAEGDEKRYWPQDLAGLYKVIGGSL